MQRMITSLLFALALCVPNVASGIELRATAVGSRVLDVVDIVNAGDGSNRLYLVTQPGLVRVMERGTLREEPFLDVRTLVSNGDELGLLSLVFAPDYATNRRFYIYYTDVNGDSVLARYRATADGRRADPASAQPIFGFPQPYVNHNGGKLLFGPDGYLYLSTGDGGSAGDPENRAQSRSMLLGKILRLDTESGSATYSVPASNPFVGQAGVRPEIWAYGLRNPWRTSFDPLTGDFYIADVGQAAREEVNVQPAGSAGGENYGWKIFEGTRCFTTSLCNGASGLTAPVAEYDHSRGCSITGGHVYRGRNYPGLVGTYLYGDFCSGRIFGLRRNGAAWVAEELLDTAFGITTFGVDEVGNIYVFDTFSGTLYLLSDGPPVPTFAPITKAYTGAWFDPDQSGHGLFVEVLADNRMVASWFTFRPEGGQAWFIATGDIALDRATLSAVIPQGARFIPNFRPGDVTLPNWGTLTLTFDDCNNGRVEYQSVAGFGSGSMRLTRLTAVAGLACP